MAGGRRRPSVTSDARGASLWEGGRVRATRGATGRATPWGGGGCLRYIPYWYCNGTHSCLSRRRRLYDRPRCRGRPTAAAARASSRLPALPQLLLLLRLPVAVTPVSRAIPFLYSRGVSGGCGGGGGGGICGGAAVVTGLAAAAAGVTVSPAGGASVTVRTDTQRHAPASSAPGWPPAPQPAATMILEGILAQHLSRQRQLPLPLPMADKQNRRHGWGDRGTVQSRTVQQALTRCCSLGSFEGSTPPSTPSNGLPFPCLCSLGPSPILMFTLSV